jgi:diaminohydroxyphosphoribosylaminopyrimidine deaminase/5-amino-6-(5-phosphoribosylamino)uracil reductase
MLSNEELMRSALHEARKGGRAVRPNPRVGCAVELSSGELLLGHHSLYGGPHAERVALSKLLSSQSAKGARVAVTLEPCSHTGKTPPCADALIDAGVSEVIIPFLDPNPLVAGQGVQKLNAAGIRVVVGECLSECFQINREWLWTKVLKRPFVTLKIATSKNSIGVATERKWITSLKARHHAMTLRARVDVLITSGATVREDDPALTVRDESDVVALEQPRVIIYSKSKELGGAQKILQHPQCGSSQLLHQRDGSGVFRM